MTRSLETIISSGVASTVVVAAPGEFLFRAREEIESVAANTETPISITAVAGGNDRTASVQNALKHIGDSEIVLVHDAARCLTPPDVFRRVRAAVQSGAGAVVPVLPMIDTVRRVVADRAGDVDPNVGAGVGADRASERIVRSIHGDSEAETALDRPDNSDSAGAGGAGHRAVVRGDLDRAELRRVQTPQGFRAEVLLRAHEQLAAAGAGSAGGAVQGGAAAADGAVQGGAAAAEGSVPTDDAGLVERLGIEVVAVAGDEEALKITYPLDRILGEHLARERDADTESTGISGNSGCETEGEPG